MLKDPVLVANRNVRFAGYNLRSGFSQWQPLAKLSSVRNPTQDAIVFTRIITVNSFSRGLFSTVTRRGLTSQYIPIVFVIYRMYSLEKSLFEQGVGAMLMRKRRWFRLLNLSTYIAITLHTVVVKFDKWYLHVLTILINARFYSTTSKNWLKKKQPISCFLYSSFEAYNHDIYCLYIFCTSNIWKGKFPPLYFSHFLVVVKFPRSPVFPVGSVCVVSPTASFTDSVDRWWELKPWNDFKRSYVLQAIARRSRFLPSFVVFFGKKKRNRRVLCGLFWLVFFFFFWGEGRGVKLSFWCFLFWEIVKGDVFFLFGRWAKGELLWISGIVWRFFRLYPSWGDGQCGCSLQDFASC